ncbi:HPr family phosphocarrier protein [Halothermothrix orenii]|uniref:Phosphocarrier protein HPr n=1 Tax=Halothermothrix orenii (strain H 168 / OCM 544 / DSM 9562) TaxID=373903 RepID=B8CY29_HALOH|nr:HPr family phosphocarrier protein [Halothermothrix orenii]ACL70198.1 Phosphotransferase system, phosphocarrier protein HPr [Halothermothrix orenii H 168]
MITEHIKVKNEEGLHARPASKFVKKANSYRSNIEIIFKDLRADGKSIMGVMSLGIRRGDKITLKIDGPDEEKARQELIDFFQAGLVKS